jgi:hypothetical protein
LYDLCDENDGKKHDIYYLNDKGFFNAEQKANIRLLSKVLIKKDD